VFWWASSPRQWSDFNGVLQLGKQTISMSVQVEVDADHSRRDKSALSRDKLRSDLNSDRLGHAELIGEQ